MLVVIAAALAGCVSASKVTSTPNGTYVIQGRAVGLWNADRERAKALKKANDYCAKQGKRVVLHNIDETGHAALLGERATITFECEA
jgi:putative hemolysin